MWIVGLAVLVGVVLYFAFQAADGLALANQTTSAKVVAKGYREAGQSYYTEIIVRLPVAQPRVTPEMYVLKLALDGREVECPVSLVLYNATNNGDQVNVTYQRRRITGALKVLNVSH
jgi:hypothetical protein